MTDGAAGTELTDTPAEASLTDLQLSVSVTVAVNVPEVVISLPPVRSNTQYPKSSTVVVAIDELLKSTSTTAPGASLEVPETLVIVPAQYSPIISGADALFPIEIPVVSADIQLPEKLAVAVSNPHP